MRLAGTSFGRAALTLAEIVMVVAIIAFLVAVAVPGFLRARKRSQGSQIVHSLPFVDAAPVYPV